MKGLIKPVNIKQISAAGNDRPLAAPSLKPDSVHHSPGDDSEKPVTPPSITERIMNIFRIPALIAVVVFMVANRQKVAISLDPFSGSAPVMTTAALPLWVWLLAAFVAGFFSGALMIRIRKKKTRVKKPVQHRNGQHASPDRTEMTEHIQALPDSTPDAGQDESGARP